MLDETPLPADLAGEGVLTLPYGPVRSGVFESVQFLVETPGEDIPHLRARVYDKHRGVEVRFQGLLPADGVLLAERVEGVALVAHAMAFSQAIESPGRRGASMSRPGAMLVRAVHAELERVANHLDSTTRQTESAMVGRRLRSPDLAQRARSRACGPNFAGPASAVA